MTFRNRIIGSIFLVLGLFSYGCASKKRVNNRSVVYVWAKDTELELTKNKSEAKLDFAIPKKYGEENANKILKSIEPQFKLNDTDKNKICKESFENLESSKSDVISGDVVWSKTWDLKFKFKEGMEKEASCIVNVDLSFEFEGKKRDLHREISFKFK